MSTRRPKSPLTVALRTLSQEKLVSQILSICEKIPEAKTFLADQLLVKGKSVHRYHADTDSEDGGDGIDGPEYEREVEVGTTRNTAIAIADDELTARFVKCDNCKMEFDVTNNKSRTCTWHTGKNMSSGLGR